MTPFYVCSSSVTCQHTSIKNFDLFRAHLYLIRLLIPSDLWIVEHEIRDTKFISAAAAFGLFYRTGLEQPLGERDSLFRIQVAQTICMLNNHFGPFLDLVTQL